MINDMEKYNDEGEAIRFLESHGFTVDAQCMIHKPSKEYLITHEEAGAMAYLVGEWDYGY